LLLFFLPYAGMLLVSTAASLLARRSSPWMGEALARLTGRTWVPPVSSASSLSGAGFSLWTDLPGEVFPVARMLFLLLPIFLLAFGLLLGYQRSLNPKLGVAEPPSCSRPWPACPPSWIWLLPGALEVRGDAPSPSLLRLRGGPTWPPFSSFRS